MNANLTVAPNTNEPDDIRRADHINACVDAVEKHCAGNPEAVEILIRMARYMACVQEQFKNGRGHLDMSGLYGDYGLLVDLRAAGVKL